MNRLLSGRENKVSRVETTLRKLTAVDYGKILEFTSNGEVKLILNENLPAGFFIEVIQVGQGSILLQTEPGASLSNQLPCSRDTIRTSGGQFSRYFLYVSSNDSGSNASYILTGDFEEVLASFEQNTISTDSILWLDASDTSTITTSFGTVSQWGDKSLQLNNFIQGTAINQPNHTEDSFIRFTSSTLLNRSPLNVPPQTLSLSLFIVGKQPRLTVGGGWGKFSSRIIPTQTPGSDRRTFVENFYSNRTVEFTSETPILEESLNILNISHSGTTLSLSINGLLVGEETNNISLSFPTLHTIGGQGNFDLSELILFNRILSEGEQEILYGYLAHKWGLVPKIPSENEFKLYTPFDESYLTITPNQTFISS